MTAGPIALDFTVTAGESADVFAFATSPVRNFLGFDARMEIWSTGATPTAVLVLQTGDATMVSGGVLGTFSCSGAASVPAIVGTYRYEMWGRDTNLGTLHPLWRGRVVIVAKRIGTLP